MLNETTEIQGSYGEITGEYVLEVTALWLWVMVTLTAVDKFQLQGNFRTADRTALWGCKFR
ncbi:hypothetical protein [Alterinioella nitratireducens]|uniref:hypothetical protein n=1 Tax=Alterinioella nitratireducens TaxID=2735915 RepID=UPI00155557A7|nr:hypothetical protein [Alterinioella nitratireducens]NPD21418.1 hypothetical protein [Alterinioella nitratireducens]